MRLAGQKIWITGSAKRLGRAMALACAREGADLIIHYHHSRHEAEETVEQVRLLGRKALLVQGDIGDPACVAKMVSQISQKWQQLDSLVLSAAVFPRKPFESVSREDFFQTIKTNLYGPFCCAQAALPLLKQSNPGRVVFLTDAAVEKPHLRASHYMASKGGVEALSKALARELAPEILVNAIAPGPVLKPEGLDEESARIILQRLPLGRWGSVESVTNALLFLLESVDLVGETVVVDAGRRWG